MIVELSKFLGSMQLHIGHLFEPKLGNIVTYQEKTETLSSSSAVVQRILCTAREALCIRCRLQTLIYKTFVQNADVDDLSTSCSRYEQWEQSYHRSVRRRCTFEITYNFTDEVKMTSQLCFRICMDVSYETQSEI